MVLFNHVNLFKLDLEAYQIGPATVHLHFKSFMGKIQIQSESLISQFYPQNKYNSSIFINPKIFVDVDGTLTFNKPG